MVGSYCGTNVPALFRVFRKILRFNKSTKLLCRTSEDTTMMPKAKMFVPKYFDFAQYLLRLPLSTS